MLDGDDAGFTLIELIIVVAILPIVVGAIAVALHLRVLAAGERVQQQVSDSNDTLVASAYFNRDVQSATNMTVQPQMGTVGGVNYFGCGQSSTTQTQLLGLEWGANSAAAGRLSDLRVLRLGFGGQPPDWRHDLFPGPPGVHQRGVGDADLVRHGLADVGSTAAVHIYESGAGGPFSEVTGTPGDPCSTWYSSQGVTKVAFTTNEPGSGFSYSLVGPPASSQSQSTVTTTTLPSSGNGCNFATPGSGQYSTQLCFVDFTGYTGATAAPCTQASRCRVRSKRPLHGELLRQPGNERLQPRPDDICRRSLASSDLLQPELQQ